METVWRYCGNTADIVRTWRGTTAFPLRTRRRSALPGHHNGVFRTPLRVGPEAGTIYFLRAIFGSIRSDDCASLLSTSIDKSRKDSFIYATSEKR